MANESTIKVQNMDVGVKLGKSVVTDLLPELRSQCGKQTGHSSAQ